MKILFRCKEYKRIGVVGQYSYIALCDVDGKYDEMVKRADIDIHVKLWMPERGCYRKRKSFAKFLQVKTIASTVRQYPNHMGKKPQCVRGPDRDQFMIQKVMDRTMPIQPCIGHFRACVFSIASIFQ
jgi:hypothetical protein